MTAISPNGGPIKRARRRRSQHWFSYIVLATAVLISIFPFYWMFVVASNDNSAINAVPPVLLPGPNFFERVGEVFNRFSFVRPFANSLVVSATVGIAVAALCSLAGFAFAKLRFPGRNLLLVLVVGTMMVPTQLNVVPLLLTVDAFGWVNTLMALIVPSAVTGFGVFWMRQYAESAVDDELLYAARVDGATTFQTFRLIVWPIMRPGASILGLFAFLEAWNDFFWPGIVLVTEDSFTVQVALRQIQTRAYAIDEGLALTGSLIATAPLLLLFMLIGRRVVGGIMEGALKA